MKTNFVLRMISVKLSNDGATVSDVTVKSQNEFTVEDLENSIDSETVTNEDGLYSYSFSSSSESKYYIKLTLNGDTAIDVTKCTSDLEILGSLPSLESTSSIEANSIQNSDLEELIKPPESCETSFSGTITASSTKQCYNVQGIYLFTLSNGESDDFSMSLYYPGALQYEKLDQANPFGVVSKETGYLEISADSETQITVTKVETSSDLSTGNYLIVSQNSDSTSSTPNAFSFSDYSRISILVNDDKLVFGSASTTKTEYTVKHSSNNHEFEELSNNKYHFTSTTIEISSIPDESSAIVYSASPDSYKIYEINSETPKLFITNENDKTSTISKTKGK